MLGIDIVDIDQIKKVHDRYGAAFLEKILTPREIADLNSVNQRVFAAVLGRYFAAKEAIFKACDDHRLGWKDIVISRITTKPRVTIKGGGGGQRVRKISLTFSVSRDMVIAQAFILA